MADGAPVRTQASSGGALGQHLIGDLPTEAEALRAIEPVVDAALDARPRGLLGHLPQLGALLGEVVAEDGGGGPRERRVTRDVAGVVRLAEIGRHDDRRVGLPRAAQRVAVLRLPAHDARIGDVSRLKEPPFSAFNTYKLLDKQTLELESGKNGSVKLPNGRSLQVSYAGLTPDNRHDVSASISQADGNSFLKLLRVSASVGQTFFVAGQSYQGGNLVLAITLR